MGPVTCIAVYLTIWWTVLVAVLPLPLKYSVTKPGPYVQSRTATIMARMMDIADPTGDPCKAAPTP